MGIEPLSNEQLANERFNTSIAISKVLNHEETDIKDRLNKLTIQK